MEDKIGKVLTSEEKRDLLSMLNDVGWKSLVKLADLVITDWSVQGMTSKPTDDDSTIAKHVIKYKGMGDGLVSFLNKLDQWKKANTKEVADN